MADNKSTLGGIPGNIKQYMIPFQLNPNESINQAVASSSSVVGPPQYFTFRPSSKNAYTSTGGCGLLRIYPASLNEEIENGGVIDDVSYQVLYNRDVVTTGKDISAIKAGIGSSNLLDNIQSVTIREYLPDTMLEQCINFFLDLMSAITNLFTKGFTKSTPKNETKSKSQSPDSTGTDNKNADETDSGFFERIKNALYYFMNQLLGVTNGNSIWSTFVDNTGVKFDSSEYPKNDSDFNAVIKIIRMPYILYYRLQSTVTTNIYELPNIDESKLINKSDGTIGWKSQDIGLTTFFGKSNIIFEKLLGNIKTHYMPFWESDKTTSAEGEEVQIKFNLFNDNVDSALINFIFVNTIVPNNRFLQYGIIQHSPCIYDVKVEGGNRLLCCAGEFSVEYSGIMRTPPDSFVETLCKTHASKALKGTDDGTGIKSFFLANNIIKIPDVYIVTMKFKSLISANFNTFIYQYAGNNKLENVYLKKNSVVYQNGGNIPSAMVETITKLVTETIDKLI